MTLTCVEMSVATASFVIKSSSIVHEFIICIISLTDIFRTEAAMSNAELGNAQGFSVWLGSTQAEVAETQRLRYDIFSREFGAQVREGKAGIESDSYSNYELMVARAARDVNVNGFFCNHIHKSELRYIDDVLYCNTGDGVESCTALVKDDSGKWSVIQWTTAATKLFSERR